MHKTRFRNLQPKLSRVWHHRAMRNLSSKGVSLRRTDQQCHHSMENLLPVFPVRHVLPNAWARVGGCLVSTLLLVMGCMPASTLQAQPLQAQPQLTAAVSTQASVPSSAPSSAQSSAATPPTPVPVITLADAIARAKKNEPNFASAVAANQVARLDHSIAISSLLPGVVYHNQYIYTQPQVLLPGTLLSAANQTPRFIANNATHEYVSQAAITETLSLQQAAAVAQTSAIAQAAAAQLEIARRGLVAAVVALYYNISATEDKAVIAQQALREASSFLLLTQQRETAREAAHADVLKAELELQQRKRDLSDAQLAAEKAKLELGVLLFPDPHTAYALQAPPRPLPLEPQSAFTTDANNHNPSLTEASSLLRAAQMDLNGTRASYLPALTLNYFYGIDAPQFALNGPGGERNLGYAAIATLDIPVWDWFATHHRVQQKTSIRNAAKVAFTATQRRLIADTDEAWSEASVAKDQLQSLDTSVATARDSLRLTRMRYAAGEATVLEVVDAQASFVLAQNAKEDGMMRYQTALANLQILTGKL